ncbi:hypothetical protein AVEN_7327-1 [Araneus ventricosus]|uniref:Uncharacterized protein n=1 Tax=Araneus ventricosus TaxID=182803 RepID=A0A4Y2BT57_ARAVE|nr:hypothetical protein AVEN_7327-1 [Araneus ventricosus]
MKNFITTLFYNQFHRSNQIKPDIFFKNQASPFVHLSSVLNCDIITKNVAQTPTRKSETCGRKNGLKTTSERRRIAANGRYRRSLTPRCNNLLAQREVISSNISHRP